MTPQYMQHVVVSGALRSTSVNDFFPGKVVKIDDIFRDFLESVDSRYSTKGLACFIFQTAAGWNTDDFIVEKLCMREISFDVNQVCLILSYLGHEGSSILDIPEGESEVNIILGYAEIKKSSLVLFIKRQINNGVDEIHLNAYLRNRWGDKTPMVLVFLG